jgi:hypothetical protein
MDEFENSYLSICIMPQLHFRNIETLAFTGGGNRFCDVQGFQHTTHLTVRLTE